MKYFLHIFIYVSIIYGRILIYSSVCLGCLYKKRRVELMRGIKKIFIFNLIYLFCICYRLAYIFLSLVYVKGACRDSNYYFLH